MSDVRTIIGEAIEEWASTAFSPNRDGGLNDPTLARYIAVKLHEAHAFEGVVTQHSIITPECRTNRGDNGAFEEAVAHP